MIETENMKKLQNRSIFDGIKYKATPIKDTTPKSKDISKQERQKEYQRIIDEIFNDE